MLLEVLTQAVRNRMEHAFNAGYRAGFEAASPSFYGWIDRTVEQHRDQECDWQIYQAENMEDL